MRRFGWKGRGEEEGARYSIKLMLHSFVFGKIEVQKWEFQRSS
jgi:hypothetical protein